MKTSFTDRVLVTGVALVSLIILSEAGLILWKAASALGDWRNWLLWDTFSPLILGLFMLLAAAALDAAVWRRLVSRRRSLRAPSLPGYSSITPRSKYAVWKPVRSVNGRAVAVGTRKPRRKPNTGTGSAGLLANESRSATTD